MRLLQRRPTFDWSRLGRLALLFGTSAGNSLLSLWEHAIYSRRWQRAAITEAPVFILGHWRSGTTLLHNLLASDPQFAAPNLYQVSFPNHFLFSERWLARCTACFLPETRPLDDIPHGWDVPGEDEIALLLMTLHSPYLLAAFPDRPDTVERLNRLQNGLTAEELARWKAAFRTFLQKLAVRNDKPPVLKSPPHTGRIPLLLEMFPQARFLYLVRHPYDVFSSTLHLERILCRQNSFTARVPPDLEEQILKRYVDLYQAYHLYRVKIPDSQRYELRFEELESDPVRSLEAIYRHFEFEGGDELADRLRPWLDRHRTYRKNTYALEETWKRRVAEEWHPVFNRYHYEK